MQGDTPSLSLSAGSLPSLSASTAAEWRKSTPRDHEAARDFSAGGQVIRLVISEVRYWRFRGKMESLRKMWCAQPQLFLREISKGFKMKSHTF